MSHIDLCSGIGGFALAAHWAGYQTEVFCERDEFCQKVLRQHWPSVPIVSDLFDFDGRRYAGADLLTAGIPCQPYSCAGKQMGNDDDRALWPEARRIIAEVRPRYVVLENVAGFIGMALDGVLSDLEAEGYETGAVVLPACAVNAPHRRDRVWVLAYAESTGRKAWSGYRVGNKKQGCVHAACTGASMAHAPRNGMEEPERENRKPHGSGKQQSGMDVIGNCLITDPDRESPGRTAKPRRECGGGQFERGLGRMADELPARMDGHFDAEPAIPRVATGIPQRAARLKALGNAIVPEVAYQILSRMKETARSPSPVTRRISL